MYRKSISIRRSMSITNLVFISAMSILFWKPTRQVSVTAKLKLKQVQGWILPFSSQWHPQDMTTDLYIMKYNYYRLRRDVMVIQKDLMLKMGLEQQHILCLFLTLRLDLIVLGSLGWILYQLGYQVGHIIFGSSGWILYELGYQVGQIIFASLGWIIYQLRYQVGQIIWQLILNTVSAKIMVGQIIFRSLGWILYQLGFQVGQIILRMLGLILYQLGYQMGQIIFGTLGWILNKRGYQVGPIIFGSLGWILYQLG